MRCTRLHVPRDAATKSCGRCRREHDRWCDLEQMRNTGTTAECRCSAFAREHVSWYACCAAAWVRSSCGRTACSARAARVPPWFATMLRPRAPCGVGGSGGERLAQSIHARGFASHERATRVPPSAIWPRPVRRRAPLLARAAFGPDLAPAHTRTREKSRLRDLKKAPMHAGAMSGAGRFRREIRPGVGAVFGMAEGIFR